MGTKEDFIADLYPAARNVSRETGMSWELMLSQAALETDWGKRVLPGTNNIFSIKADSSWEGERKSFIFVQYVNGSKVGIDHDFRVHGSYDDSLRHRVQSLKESPAFNAMGLFSEPVRGNCEREAKVMQYVGYTTDSHYAEQIQAVFHGPAMQNGIRLAKEREDDISARGMHPSRARLPFITEEAHPANQLYLEIGSRLAEKGGGKPREEFVANLTLLAMENGITDSAKVKDVLLQGANVHVLGVIPGSRASADLNLPTPSIQQTVVQIDRFILDVHGGPGGDRHAEAPSANPRPSESGHKL